MHRNVNKNHRLMQLPVSNMSTWSENGKDIFAVFRENETRKLYCGNSLLGLELLLFPKLLSLAFILLSVAASFTKMSLSKQKSWQKCRDFQHNWSVSYFFTEVNGIPVCLVWSQQVSVLNKYNIRHHCETHHAERYFGLQGQPRREKVKELIAGLKK